LLLLFIEQQYIMIKEDLNNALSIKAFIKKVFMLKSFPEGYTAQGLIGISPC